MTKITVNDRIVAAATELFFQKGFLCTTVADLVKKSEVSESTIRRYFDGKYSIYSAVLEVSACSVKEKFLEEINQANFDIEISDPKKLVLLYVQVVLNLWQSEGMPKWQIGMLFGYDGTASERGSEKELVTKGAMKDIDTLDSIILRGCNNNQTKARHTSCIILGTLLEYVHAEIDSPIGYDRQYKADGILELLDVFLSAVLQNQQILFDELEGQSVSAESLIQLSNEMKICADAIDRVLNK